MNNSENSFENNKNVKALVYTIMVCSALFLFFIVTSFSLPQITQPIADEGIEVNLGSDNDGFGEEQPQQIGENISEQATETTENTNINPSENSEPEIPNDEPNLNAKAEKTPQKNSSVTSVKENNVKPIEKVPQPKTLFTGIKKGGNNSNINNNASSQGDGFGKGDKGKPNGNPNSNSYEGTNYSGNNGLSIKSGLKGRGIKIKPSFTDEFTENAKVLVDVEVDLNGNVTNASINPRGTTTTNGNIREIAKRKAKEIKFTPGKDEDFGTILFEFKVTN